MLQVQNIEKYYGSQNQVTKALDRVSFTVEDGAFIAIMGASGSGKTTLLNCISTIDTISAGDILLDGQSIAQLSPRQLAQFRRERLGFVFQDCNLLDTLTLEENIGLAHLCARRFLGRGMEYDDLFQAGCVGLLKAVENFDTSRGVKFSTYAVPVILGEIRRLFRDGGALRVSRGLRDLSRKALEEADKLRQETGESPGVAQIAQRLGVPVEKAALALGVGQAPMSLTDGEEGGDLDIPVEAPEERMTERMTLYQILHTLEERDQKLIRCRYFQGKTQSQTAAELGMTQVQVSRREKKLLAYMRAAFDQ